MFTCNKCDASLYCKHQVWGKGSPDADIMFIGENPGYHEDKRNEPFVGNSGKELDVFLEICGLQRQYIYITNAVKCKTSQNTTPSEFEIDNCRHYLIQEIETVKPFIIVLLGSTAFRSLMLRNPNRIIDKEFRISSIVGEWFRWNDINCVTLYHPSYILRDKTRRPDYLVQFKKIIDKYREINQLHQTLY